MENIHLQNPSTSPDKAGKGSGESLMKKYGFFVAAILFLILFFMPTPEVI